MHTVFPSRSIQRSQLWVYRIKHIFCIVLIRENDNWALERTLVRSEVLIARKVDLDLLSHCCNRNAVAPLRWNSPPRFRLSWISGNTSHAFSQQDSLHYLWRQRWPISPIRYCHLPLRRRYRPFSMPSIVIGTSTKYTKGKFTRCWTKPTPQCYGIRRSVATSGVSFVQVWACGNFAKYMSPWATHRILPSRYVKFCDAFAHQQICMPTRHHKHLCIARALRTLTMPDGIQGAIEEVDYYHAVFALLPSEI